MLGAGTILTMTATSNADAARAFYVDTLGLTLREETPFALVLTGGGAMLRVQKVAPNGDRIAWFKDPDGNILSLTQFA